MRKTHFFAAYSRLGLINPPHGSQEFNYGVETAPDFILDPAFLALFKSYKIDGKKFIFPEKIAKEQYQRFLAQESFKFATLINQSLLNDETQVVIGGDHSVGFSAVLAVLKRYSPQEVAYIHFDSHADTSSMIDSPSQNFHGQFLRALIDEDFHPELKRNKSELLLAKNTLIIGDLEADDFDYIHQAGINYADGKDTVQILAMIQKITQNTKHLHIGFDIDVFQQDLVEATGTPNHWGGLTKKDIFPILEYLATYQDISVDLVEVNPQKTTSQQTIELAQEVLTTLLEV